MLRIPRTFGAGSADLSASVIAIFVVARSSRVIRFQAMVGDMPVTPALRAAREQPLPSQETVLQSLVGSICRIFCTASWIRH